MTETGERDVLDVDPANLEDPLPLVGGPDVARRLIVDRREHLSHAGKVSAARCEEGRSARAFQECERWTTHLALTEKKR